MKPVHIFRNLTMILLGVAATDSWAPPLTDYPCTTTIDLRNGGTQDRIRLTNQGQSPVLLPFSFQIVNTAGNAVAPFLWFDLAPNASSTRTVGQIFQEVGLNSFNSNFLIRLGGLGTTSGWPVFQGSYTNAATGLRTPLVITCPGQDI